MADAKNLTTNGIDPMAGVPSDPADTDEEVLAEEPEGEETEETADESAESEETGDEESEEESSEEEAEPAEPEDEVFALTGRDGQQREYTFDEIAGILDKYEEDTMEMQNVIAQAAPLIQRINKSEIMQTAMGWLERGATEEQVIAGIAALHAQKAQAVKEPKFETDEERFQYYVRKEAEKMIAPLEQQLKQFQDTSAKKDVLASNDNTFRSALSQFGYRMDLLNDGQVKKLIKAQKDFFPQLDVSRDRITDNQALVMVEKGLGMRKGLKKELEASQAGKAQLKRVAKGIIQRAQAPKIAGGKGKKASPKQAARTEAPREFRNMEERAAFMDSLMFGEKK